MEVKKTTENSAKPMDAGETIQVHKEVVHTWVLLSITSHSHLFSTIIPINISECAHAGIDPDIGKKRSSLSDEAIKCPSELPDLLLEPAEALIENPEKKIKIE